MNATRPTDAPAIRRSARMEQRISTEDKALIERAAALLGLNASEFMVEQGLRAARETLTRFRVTVATQDDAQVLLRALDEANEPTEALGALMQADLGMPRA